MVAALLRRNPLRPKSRWILIKAPIVVPDSGGLQSLAAAEPNGTLNVGHLPFPDQNKTPIVQRGAEGPDALQGWIKAPMVVSDHCLPREGRAPLS